METKDIILDLRTKKGLSQDELAELVFVTRQAVSRWESGDIHKMKRPMIVALARTLKIDPLVFLQREEVLMPDEERLITAYRQASEEIKGAALAMLEDSAAKNRKTPAQGSSAG